MIIDDNDLRQVVALINPFTVLYKEMIPSYGDPNYLL
jgi:hypothetical protein